MASIKIKFRPSLATGKEGVIYYEGFYLQLTK